MNTGFTGEVIPENPELPSVLPDTVERELRPLTGGAVMSGASRIVTAVAGAVVTIFVARLLGPSGSGGFALAISLLALLLVATTLGVEHGIAYFVGAGRWAAASAFGSSQRVSLVVGVCGAGLAMLARDVVPSAFGNLTVAETAVAAFALPFALSWLYFTYIALASDHYEAYVLPPAAQALLTLVLALILGAIYGLAGAIVGFALAHVITAVACTVTARRIFPPAGSEDGVRHLRRAISFGVRGYAANALQFLNYRLDLFILAGVATAADVGHYAVAVSVTSVMWLLPQALSDVLLPRVAALRARGGEAEESLPWVEAKTLRHTVLAVAAMMVVLAAALVFLVVPIYGAGFEASIDLGLILLPGVALLGLCGTMSSSVVGRGHPGYMLRCTIIVTPLTVALYALLIPALNAEGAALASTISYSLTFAIVLYFYGRAAGVPVLGRLVPTRSEIDDYRALAPAIREWAAGVRGRRLGPRS